MLSKPTKSNRNVVLALRIVNSALTEPAMGARGTVRIKRICALFCEDAQITESLYSEKDEAVLLRRFWSDIRHNDRIFSANVLRDMAAVRERSWQLGVFPAADVDLRCVYGIEMWDTEQMWAAGYVPHVPYAQHIDDVGWPVDGEHIVRIEPECVHSRD